MVGAPGEVRAPHPLPAGDCVVGGNGFLVKPVLAMARSLLVAPLLDALHQLAPLGGRPLLVVHAFLFAAASDAELDTAAEAHEAQAASPATRPSGRPCAGPGRWSIRCGSPPATATRPRLWPTCLPSLRRS
jgi:hypothetical protein